jgi:protein-disulfide isomerase
VAATLWAVSVRRQADRRVAGVRHRLARLEGLADATQASAEAFDSAMLTVEDGRAQLVKLGTQLGLKPDQINKCMDSPADNDRINATGQEAVSRYALTGTPTFVINGKALESGGLPYEDLAKKLDQAARESR